MMKILENEMFRYDTLRRLCLIELRGKGGFQKLESSLQPLREF